ncbi:MAG TPA: hypothetical protein VK144_05040 [Bacillota bacterium]|nr:hypothetical protein [Bacillota bacterium]
MRIQQVNPSEHSAHQTQKFRLQPGQILRGRVLQIYPLDRAIIQLGSFRFVAQLEAALEHGQSYYFQVADVQEDVHLRVMQQVQEHGNNEWRQLLQMIGSKSSNIREELLQQLIQHNIPFTKRSLQRMFTLLDEHPSQRKAFNALVRMMQHNWALTKEVMESVIAYQSSTFTNQISHVYESLSQYTTTNQVHQSLLQHLEKLYFTANETGKLFQVLMEHSVTREDKVDIQWLKWMHPQLHKARVAQLESMTTFDIKESFQTSSQYLQFLGVQTKEEQQVFYQMFHAMLRDVEGFQQDIHRFLNRWERNIQLQAIHHSKEQLDAVTYEKLQNSFIKMFPFKHMSKEQQIVIQQHIPNQVHQVLQMMVDLKGMPFDVLESMNRVLEQKNAMSPSAQHQTDFLRAVQHIIHNIGLSYEHMILEDINNPMNTLKGLLLQFIQEQGAGSKQAKNLLQFIQGMQLHTVQETAHMLSVQLLIPAMIGRLQSDIHLTFDRKKTSRQTIDPEYCRILFDLELAALKRTMIDMHIQNKQVSFVVYTDFAHIQQVATPFEPTLKANLKKTGYEVTSIHYQALSKHVHKPFHSRTHMDRPEGFDIKI